MLHRMTGMSAAKRQALLPETLRLLERILEAQTYGELKDLSRADFPGTASYGAWPESNLPFAKFQIVEADPALLSLAGMETPGFEVLQAGCGGFQFHWRNDLTRAFETEMPVLGRFVARMPEEQAIIIEHFVLPMLVRHRVRKLWGWIVLGREAAADVTRLGCALALERAEGPCQITHPGSGSGGRDGQRSGSASLRPVPRESRPPSLQKRRQQHAR